MSEHVGSERLNDYLDGLLEGAERAAVEEHLERCSSCADLLAELSALITGLGGLPLEARSARDLWPGIRERMRAAEGMAGATEGEGMARGSEGEGDRAGARVLAFPAAAPTGSAGRARRRVSFTLPQLYAAGIAVALFSAGSVWWALSGGSSGVRIAETPPAADEGDVTRASLPLDAAVTDLEAALEVGRALLDEQTLRVIEESLAAIDQAIREARAALQKDPGSDFLNRLLIQRQKDKLRVLRQATAGLVQS